MKRLIFIVIIFLSIAGFAYCNEGVGFYGSGSGGSGGSCTLLSSDYEGESDGTDLDAISAAWIEVGAATDMFEIDTAQYHNGIASEKSYNGSATQEMRVYRTHTEQNGTYTVSFWFRWNDNSDSFIEFMALTDGDFGWLSTITVTLYVSTTDGSIYYHNGSSWNDTGGDVSADTWTKIDIISDLSTDTFDLEISDILVGDDLSMQSSGLSPDRIYLEFYSGVSDAGTIWIDDTCIE